MSDKRGESWGESWGVSLVEDSPDGSPADYIFSKSEIEYFNKLGVVFIDEVGQWCMDYDFCPRCGSPKTKGHGSKQPSFYDHVLKKWISYKIDLYRCQNCRHKYSEIVPFLIQRITSDGYAPRLTRRTFNAVKAMTKFKHYSNADISRETGVDEKIVRNIRKLVTGF